MGIELVHRPADSFKGTPGTPENIAALAKKFEQSGVVGILVGGCTDNAKQFPRKDIDIVVSSSAIPAELEDYDAWFHYGDRTETIRGAIIYNSLGSLDIALGNLTPGLHVVRELHADLRADLPVTSYSSLADIIKPDSRDILAQYTGKPVAFSFQGRSFIGIFLQSDMWMVQFDDLVELGKQHEFNQQQKEKLQDRLEQLFMEELQQFDNIVDPYLKRYFSTINTISDLSNVRINDSVYLKGDWNTLVEQYILMSKSQNTSIPKSLMERYDAVTLENRVLTEIGRPLQPFDIETAVQKTKEEVLWKIFYYLHDESPIFSTAVYTDFETYLNPKFGPITLNAWPTRRITIDGENLKVDIALIVDEEAQLPEHITDRMADLRRKFVNHSYLFPDSSNIFNQYSAILGRNILPYFAGYVGSKVVAKQSILNLTNSPPLKVIS